MERNRGFVAENSHKASCIWRERGNAPPWPSFRLHILHDAVALRASYPAYRAQTRCLNVRAHC
jgi:hypothetical protein